MQNPNSPNAWRWSWERVADSMPSRQNAPMKVHSLHVLIVMYKTVGTPHPSSSCLPKVEAVPYELTQETDAGDPKIGVCGGRAMQQITIRGYCSFIGADWVLMLMQT